MTAAENVAGMLDRVRQMYCGLHGHDTLLQFEQDRMFLKCTSCGHESPGWDLADAPPPAVSDSNIEPARPRAIMRPQLVGARRVA
jgi:hypothetical protein